MVSTERTLEFDKIKEKLAEFAVTERAKTEIQNLRPFLKEMDVRARLRETGEAKALMEKCGNPPSTSLQGIDASIETAGKGGCLTPEELSAVAVTLTGVRRLKDYLARGKVYEIGLSWFEENLDPLDEIREEIHTKIRGGRVDD